MFILYDVTSYHISYIIIQVAALRPDGRPGAPRPRGYAHCRQLVPAGRAREGLQRDQRLRQRGLLSGPRPREHRPAQELLVYYHYYYDSVIMIVIIHIYKYMCIHLYVICIYISLSLSIYIYIYTYVNTSLSLYIYIYIHIYVYVYIVCISI